MSEVKNTGDIVFVKVYFTSTFLGLHKTIKKAYTPQLRVAELRAIKTGKKWETFITRIAFYKQEKIESKVIKDAATKNPNELSMQEPTVVTEKVTSDKTGKVVSQIPEASEKIQKKLSIDSVKTVNAITNSAQSDSLSIAPFKIQVSDFDNLNKKLVDYKLKYKASRLLSAGSVIGGLLTIVLTSSNHKAYNNTLEQNNQAYKNWYLATGLGTPPASELAKITTLSEFAPSFPIAIGTFVAAGIGFFILSTKYGKLMQETQSQLSNIRKNTSFIPQFDIKNQHLGFQLAYKF